MADILLSSEAFVKNATSISDNIAGKFLLPSLREAQEHSLRSIVGDALLDKLKRLVATHEIDAEENQAYKTLLNGYCQFFLAYTTVVEVMNKVSYKVGNFGVAKSTDENLAVASFDEIVKMQYYYQSKADAYCINLQNFLLGNRSLFPELTENCCNAIRSNLHSAASCGIFLGGARGKDLRR